MGGRFKKLIKIFNLQLGKPSKLSLQLVFFKQLKKLLIKMQNKKTFQRRPLKRIFSLFLFSVVRFFNLIYSIPFTLSINHTQFNLFRHFPSISNS